MCGWSTDFPDVTTDQPSCRYNCGSDMGSCSCSSSCQWNGNCCHDFNYECGHLQTTAPTPGNCGGYLYGSSGTFESPNYPNNYQNYLDCTWYIRPGRQFIRLQISDLDTECCCDWVYVYDGSSTSSRNVLQLCSTNYVVYHSTGRYLTVRFRTDGSVTNRGFQASYTSVAESSCQYNCGYQAGNCSCSSDCEYRGTCCDDFRAQPSCRYNCGNHLGSCSCSSSCQYNGNCCDDFYSYCDYGTTEYPTTWSCGGSLFGSGTLTSPNHPGHYSDNSYCVWQLRAAYDQRVFLEFSYLE
ncbi:PREDICTED: deleted in malignant brain tumors 1 protein-like [Cyprinodon variegatus]|uniref:deleted in malignant brain tumors 1 protein-like n=1 Tax=Cyprinodon variegatus TaxID=28743 RepID=UPI0007429A7D|nr:PREDICTED: deleted in malignant brain tumors 1 protein-like [Cyprinodon variegatus]